jgi:hypothetical protein
VTLSYALKVTYATPSKKTNFKNQSLNESNTHN